MPHHNCLEMHQSLMFLTNDYKFFSTELDEIYFFFYNFKVGSKFFHFQNHCFDNRGSITFVLSENPTLFL